MLGRGDIEGSWYHTPEMEKEIEKDQVAVNNYQLAGLDLALRPSS